MSDDRPCYCGEPWFGIAPHRHDLKPTEPPRLAPSASGHAAIEYWIDGGRLIIRPHKN